VGKLSGLARFDNKYISLSITKKVSGVAPKNLYIKQGEEVKNLGTALAQVLGGQARPFPRQGARKILE